MNRNLILRFRSFSTQGRISIGREEGTAHQPCIVVRPVEQPQETGGAALVRALVSSGISRMFGIPGTHTVPIYKALEANSREIQHVLTRHEQGAGFAAEGYARASGDVAAVCTVSGIGLTNMLTSMANAMADSVPMVVISSEVPLYWHGRPSRQYSHQVRNLSSVVDGNFAKASLHVTDANEIFACTVEAVELAKRGRPGPVHINVGIDALVQEVDAPPAPRLSEAPQPSRWEAVNRRQLNRPYLPPCPAEKPQTKQRASEQRQEQLQRQLRVAARRLSDCRYPLIVAGGGCKGDGGCGGSAAALVRQLAEQLGAPVLTTVAGKGVLPEDHFLSGGSRLHFPAMQRALLAKADGVLLLGTQLSPTDYWQFQHDKEVPVPFNANTLHVNLDAQNLEEVGVAARGGTALQADVADVCGTLLSEPSLTARSCPTWDGDVEGCVSRAVSMTESRRNMTDHLMFDFESPASGGDQMRRTLAMLRGALGSDSPLVADVCRIGYTALSSFPVSKPRKFIYPVGTTTLGAGLPMAIGAAVANPGTCVGLVAGDGGFQFTMPELSVAVAEKLPLLMAVWNDASYGEIRRSLSSGFATKLDHNPDFEHVCSAYGIPHFRIDDCSRLSSVLLESEVVDCLAGTGGPVMVEICRPWDVSPAAGEKPGLVLGAMTFGWEQASTPVDVPTAAKMLSEFVDRTGAAEVDTARLYAGGDGEAVLAEALATLPVETQDRVKVATKVNPAGVCGDDAITGGFAAPKLVEQAVESFEALDRTCVDTFYLHWPDRQVPLEEALEQVQLLHEEGRFKRLGLSNFTAEEVKIICELATERGWLRPSVYQGLYNALNRGAETGLLPTLREQSISFYAYNPLAGGLLSGRHDLRNLKSTEGRFKNNDFYYARYGKEDIFRALADLSVACEHHSVGMADASLRWMVHHSSLAAQAGDRLILGCSSVEQLQQNLASCVDQPKLPLELVNAFEYAWDVSKHSSASFASYGTSGSMLQTEVTAVGLQDSGDEVLVNFHDGQRCSFRANWLLDASPDNVSESFTRLDSEIVRRRAGVNAVDASQSADATSVDVTFSDGSNHIFRADWLRAFSPFVSENRGAASAMVSRKVSGESLSDELFATKRNLWESGFECEQFEARDLLTSESFSGRIAAIESLCTDGIVVITGMEAPSSLNLEDAGKPLERIANALAGKLYQHPRRKSTTGVMRKNMITNNTKHLADYQLDQKLAMHNDHAFIRDGACGYWQMLHQAEGSATAKVVNAAAVANELRHADPEAFHLLATVPVTHSLRTIHYTRDGGYTGDIGHHHDGVFEDEASHPILNLRFNSAGEQYVESVRHQEIKRGVCAVSFDKQEAFMAAYRKWIALCESDQFVSYVDWPENSLIIVNNGWVLHGRGVPKAGSRERVMVWGYVQKHIVDLNYRLLKQRELEQQGITAKWSTRIPNEVLAQLISLKGKGN